MKYLDKSVLFIVLLACNLTASNVHGSNQTSTIDVLALYTPEVANKYKGNPVPRISHLFAITNKIFSDSKVDLVVRLVHTAEVDYAEVGSAETALQDMTYESDKVFEGITSLRAKYGADTVILYRRWDPSHGGCGVAWVGGNQMNGDFSGYWEKDYAYSHVAIDTCDDFITAHELGHNLGLNHSRLQDGVGGTFDYALGHGESGNFVTIMAYHSSFDVSQRKGKIYKFSSPDLDCNGTACGIERTASDGADAVHALGVSGPQVANYFEAIEIEEENEENSYLIAQLNSVNSLLEIAKETLNTATLNYNTASNTKNYVQAIFNLQYEKTLALENETKSSYSLISSFLKEALLEWKTATDKRRWQLFTAYIEKHQLYTDKLAELQAATDKANATADWLEIYTAEVEVKQQEVQTAELATNNLNTQLENLQASL